jgi:hypothetical protein
MCTGCRHVRKRVSERDLNPHGCDLQVWLLDFRVGAGTAGQRVAYVSEAGIEPIAHAFALTAEFTLGVDSGR